MGPELRNRLIIGPLLSSCAIAAVLWDFSTARHYGVLILLAAAILLSCRELQRMAKEVAGPVQILPMAAISMALLAEAYVKSDPAANAFFLEHNRYLIDRLQGMPLTQVLLAVGLLWTVLIQMSRRGAEQFFTNVGLTTFGMIYIGVAVNLLLHLAMLSGSAEYYGTPYPNRGNQLLIAYLLSCKLGDVSAFFGGRAFGKHKMAPTVSPGKTWEGFAFSFIGSTGGAYLAMLVFNAICDHAPFNGWWQPAVWGLVLGPLGVVGDLAESCMKRQAARKDSGTSIPGFGGALDVFDALILAAPVAYVMALIL